MTTMFISFIIPVHNSELTLDKCLRSIFNVEYPSTWYEVIVVDNNSSDNSVEIAKKYPVTVLSKSTGTISSIRNFGARCSRGEVLAFVDSDCILKTSWLLEAVKVMNDQTIAAAGTGYSTPEKFTWVEKAWLYELDRQPFAASSLPGGNIIIRRSVFESISGFDERLETGEDSDICARLLAGNYTIINCPNMKNIHLGNSKTLLQFIKKEYWYGKNMIECVVSNPFDKVFYMSILTTVATTSVAAGIASLSISDNSNMITLSCIVVALSIFTSAIYRVAISKKYNYVLHIAVLYFIYYHVRTCAVVKTLVDKMKECRD